MGEYKCCSAIVYAKKSSKHLERNLFVIQPKLAFKLMNKFKKKVVLKRQNTIAKDISFK